MRAKKQFGQNWLIDEKVVLDMISGSKVQKGDLVVEIGPGKGVLTEQLLKVGARVIAIEKDRDLIPILQEKFRCPTPKLKLIEGDVRDVDIGETTNHESYKVIANIPYYITGLIMRKFLTDDHQPSMMALLVQREVADRVVLNDGKESVLSLSVKSYGKPRKLRNVKAGAFRPIPKVDSAILQITEISRDWFSNNKISEKTFFKVVKQAFNQKRKTLGSSLGITSDLAARRPETLTMSDWVQILSSWQGTSTNHSD